MADRRTPIPHNEKRACLCRDGSYSKKCCGGDYFNQGIGSITQTRFRIYTEQGDKLVQENGDKLYQ